MTVHSDWGDWLPQEIEDEDPDGVTVWYLGCNGFVIKGRSGITLFIDPYLGTGDPPRVIRMIPVPFDPTDIRSAAAILTTHEHIDHTHGPSQAPILANTGATFYGPDESHSVTRSDGWTEHYAVEDSQFQPVSEGESFTIGEFTVHVHSATDPDAKHPVSYVIEHDAGTIVHAGDSKPADSFERIGKTYDIDLGILAFGTVGMMPDRNSGEPVRTKYYNSETQLIDAANALQVDRLLPSHWDMWKRVTADPTVLHSHSRGFTYPRALEIVEIGDSIEL